MEPGRIIIAVGAVIEDGKGNILLVKHVPERGGFWQRKWICPGGKLNLGEKIEDGIKREVREETHLDIILKTPIKPFERIVRSGDQIELHVVYIDYLAEVIGGKLEPDDDVGEAIWIGKNAISTIWDELHEDTRKLLTMAGIKV
ncbi:MAG: NUDIX domain-containing protein [Desulfobacterales bacterium]|nr:NUDIX domain-containing protein [Desulfobacterales bacterium]